MKAIYLTILISSILSCNSANNKYQENCFSKENFNQVYNYVNNQIIDSNTAFIMLHEYEVHPEQNEKTLLIKQKGYTLAKINVKKGVFSLNKSKKHNEKMVETANNLFCELLKLSK